MSEAKRWQTGCTSSMPSRSGSPFPGRRSSRIEALRSARRGLLRSSAMPSAKPDGAATTRESTTVSAMITWMRCAAKGLIARGRAVSSRPRILKEAARAMTVAASWLANRTCAGLLARLTDRASRAVDPSQPPPSRNRRTGRLLDSDWRTPRGWRLEAVCGAGGRSLPNSAEAGNPPERTCPPPLERSTARATMGRPGRGVF